MAPRFLHTSFSNILHHLSYFQAGNLRLEVYDQEDEPRFPIAVFEPPDPTKRPMYCKSKVRLFEAVKIVYLHVTVHIQGAEVHCSSACL